MPKQSVPIFNADDPRQYPQRSNAIVPGILYTPKTTTLWGAPGSGKSHLALDLACAVAQSYTVVYVAAEAVDEFLPRIDAWREYYKKSLKNLWFWQEPVMVLSATSCQRFLDAVSAMKPAAVFIDPLAECFVGGDENSTEDMTKAIRSINLIRTQLQAAICLLHHSGWSDGHERGSSVLRGATRLNLSVRMQGETITLKAVKRNAGRLADERYFKIMEVGSEEHTILVPAPREMHPITGELPKKQQEVLSALAMSVFRTNVKPHDLAEYLEMGTSTFYKVTNALVDRSLVAKDPRTGFLSLTPTGETVAKDIEWKSGMESGMDSGNQALRLNWTPVDSTSIPPSVHLDSTAFPLSENSGPSHSTFLSTLSSLKESGEVEADGGNKSGKEDSKVM